MASIPSTRFPSTPTTKTSYRKSRLFHLRPFPSSSPKFPSFTSCRCQSSSSSGTDDAGSKQRRWDSIFQDAVKAAVKRWEDYVGSLTSSQGAEKEENREELEVAGNGEIVAEDTVVWDWERWKKHFDDVEEQARIVSVLKAQLKDAVLLEDYRDAARLQRVIAAAVRNDAVGSAIQLLNKAIEEERYYEAAQIRDNAGTGLIGWWAGRSEDSADPQGRIIHISAEHGRYVARSYNSRQLVSGRSGHPLFEIYFTVGNKGEYKQQAVYLKRKDMKLENSLNKTTEPVIIENSSSLSSSAEEKDDLSIEEDGDVDESDKDSEIADGIAGIQNILQDLIPGVKVKVLKVVSSGKVDRDLIAKVIEQIMEEEDDEDDSQDDDEDDDQDIEIETVELDDDSILESEPQGIIVDSGDATLDTADENSELSVKFVVSGIAQNTAVDASSSDFIRMPAKLEKLSRFSFSFSVMTDNSLNGPDKKEQKIPDAVSRSSNIRSADEIMADLTEVLTSKKRIPLKVLKDVGDLINLTVNQDQIPRPLSGKMFFNRINIPETSDPLSGLYISARGMFSSEVLYLRRKFGQWQEDGRKQEAIDLEFYEYVEALKLMGDPSVPAGQVAFRAKIGKRNQLPHKGIIPEEFGVVARYKGQGRLAEPGFRNPRWVDGELVILNGKYIRGGGPVIGFVYWAPEYHFLMFFNQLRLQN